MDLRQLSTPASEPLTLAEARVHLRLDTTEQDALIVAWIQAARQQVEAYTGRALLPQDWELRLPRFPRSGAPIEVPHAPLIAVTSLTTYDATGAATALAATAYQVDAPAGPTAQRAAIWPPAGGSWASTAAGVRGAVRLRYQAGYASPSTVPAPLRAAMLLLVGDLYENREAGVQTRGTAPQSLSENPTVGKLMAPFKLWNL